MNNLCANKITRAISVILPVFNEETGIRSVVESALEFLPRFFADYELILVNNGSYDGTDEVLNDLARKHGNLVVVDHKRNLYYGMAIRAGLEKAQYPLVCFMDSDGQFDIAETGKLITFIDEYDIVVGVRKKRSDSWFRIILGKLYHWINAALFNISAKDPTCGFKIFKKDILQNFQLTSRSAFINIEIFVKAKKKGCSIKEVLINHYPRQSGREKGASLKTCFLKSSEMAVFFFRERCGR